MSPVAANKVRPFGPLGSSIHLTKSDSKIARSLTVVLESPGPKIAIDCPWPMLS